MFAFDTSFNTCVLFCNRKLDKMDKKKKKHKKKHQEQSESEDKQRSGMLLCFLITTAACHFCVF